MFKNTEKCNTLVSYNTGVFKSRVNCLLIQFKNTCLAYARGNISIFV